MQRIGEYKAESHAAAQSEHLTSSMAERLRRSWALYVETRSSVEIADTGDDPSPFYALARARGLYRP